jgi:hypothetical protein
MHEGGKGKGTGGMEDEGEGRRISVKGQVQRGP